MTARTTVGDLLEHWENSRQSKRPTGLTASANTPLCRRQEALRLHAVEPTDQPRVVTSATVGSMIHLGYEDAWHMLDPDAITERHGAHGTADCIRPLAREVRDLKTKGASAFDWLLERGPDASVWEQVLIYGADADLDDDWTLVVDVVCREDGRTITFTRPYSRAEGRAAVDALERLEADLLASDPWEWAPEGKRLKNGAGDTWLCNGCPWRTACWGAEAERPHRYTAPELEAAVRQYAAARAAVRDAEALMADAREVLISVEGGEVAEYTVKWLPRKGRRTLTLDPEGDLRATYRVGEPTYALEVKLTG